jgi:hypothetical protein
LYSNVDILGFGIWITSLSYRASIFIFRFLLNQSSIFDACNSKYVVGNLYKFVNLGSLTFGLTSMTKY